MQLVVVPEEGKNTPAIFHRQKQNQEYAHSPSKNSVETLEYVVNESESYSFVGAILKMAKN